MARSSSAAAAPRRSLIAQRLDRIETRRAPGGIERRQEGEPEGHHQHGRDFAGVDLRRDLREEIDRLVEERDVQHVLQELADLLDIRGENDAQDKARERADHADAGAAQDEDAQDHAARRAHGAEYGDVARLVLHQHDHAGDDVEGGDQDDQRQDDEHDVALDLDRAEESVAALPVVDDRRAGELLRDAGADGAGAVGVVDEDLQARHRIGLLEEKLRRRQRHEEDAAVILVHADLEGAGDLIGLDPRHVAEGRRLAVGRQQREGIAGMEAEAQSELAADEDLVVGELLERLGRDMARQQTLRLEVALAHAAHHDAGRAAIGAGEHLTLDQRVDRDDSGHALEVGRELVEILEPALGRDDAEMAVESEDLAQQLGMEAVHHGHDDDQRRDAEHDAQEREDGDDGDEAFLAAGAEIAERHHALEGVEGHLERAPLNSGWTRTETPLRAKRGEGGTRVAGG